MGEYFNAADVKERGRLITWNRSFLTRPPVFSNRLVMVLFNGLREVAPDVSKPDELKHFYESYAAGAWLRFNLYDYAPPAPVETVQKNKDFKPGDVIESIGPDGLRQERVHVE